ncbi:hypothetical protein AB0O67_12245 [Streptomyces sp. NPDC086077]|uniref:hypothetical protein n=1 Tax=Streptomyces sp. NPDC086077 TaxID=3154862 RepID=UPI00342F22B9
MPDNPHWKLSRWSPTSRKDFADPASAVVGAEFVGDRQDGSDARVRIVDTVLGPRATPSTLARLRVDAGRPGVRVV